MQSDYQSKYWTKKMPTNIKKHYCIIDDEGKRLKHFHSRIEAVDALKKMSDGKGANRGLKVLRKDDEKGKRLPLPNVTLLEKKLIFNQEQRIYIVRDQDEKCQITSDKELAFELFCERGNHEC